MQGQAVTDMTADEITTEYPTVTLEGFRCCLRCQRGNTPDSPDPVKFKLNENLPASAASKLTDAGHSVDTVVDEIWLALPTQTLSARQP